MVIQYIRLAYQSRAGFCKLRKVWKYIPRETGSMMTSTTSWVQIMPYNPKTRSIRISRGMFSRPSG